MRARVIRGQVGTLAERHGRRKVLHCFGDSHAFVFKDLAKRSALRTTWIDFMIVPGATAFGLANPNSRTNAFSEFTSVIRRLPVGRRLLFMLGEVDCGFLIWYRAQKQGVTVADQLELSLHNYTEFLNDLLRGGRRGLLVAAVPPPTILEGQAWGAVATARREVTASLMDRTNLTRRYNARLLEWCTAHECVFLDYTEPMLDPSTGLIRDEFRHPDPLNHHVHPERFEELLAERLRRAGFN